jgi:hypothetical protein
MQTATFTWTFTPKDYGVAAGTHTAVALADWSKQAAEGSETNNAKGCSWSVTTSRADTKAPERALSLLSPATWLVGPWGVPVGATLQSVQEGVHAVLEDRGRVPESG